MTLGRFDEARQVSERALAKNLEVAGLRPTLFAIGSVKGDSVLMQEQLEWARSRAEYVALTWEAEALSAGGQLARARELYSSAVAQASTQKAMASAARIAAEAALSQAAFGECDRANGYIRKSLELVPAPHRAVPLVLALCGDPHRAQTIADQLAAGRPDETALKEIYLPVVRAAIEARRGNDSAAANLLGTAARFDQAHVYWAAYWANWLRGSIYLRRNAFREAMGEFDKVRLHRGWNPMSSLYPLAHLEFARAAALSGDVPGSRTAYEALLRLWKDGDPDLPQLVAARKEYQQLDGRQSVR
jgi:tetratricopeptide (TPR) repeat protein